MDRRAFLKSVGALGITFTLPVPLDAATGPQLDQACNALCDTWEIYGTNDFGTISFAHFEPPRSRMEAYGFADAGDVELSVIEINPDLYEPISALYRQKIAGQYLNASYADRDDDIDARVEREWRDWYRRATDDEQTAINRIIDTWLGEEPDWCTESDALPFTADAQGAAYQHLQNESPDILGALGIEIIEGQCPGSTYYAARLTIPEAAANAIATACGWPIRFVMEDTA